MSTRIVSSMAKTPEEYKARRAENHQKHYSELVAFNERELAKYQAKADKAAAAGKSKAAERSLKVVAKVQERLDKARAELADGSWD